MIRFSCGASPVTIRMRATAKVLNSSRRVVIDGGGLVTLSGQRRQRILHLNTCDRRQEWTTSHCQDQATPNLTIERLGLVEGNATGRQFDGGGGGAILDRGGRLRIPGSLFTDNRGDSTGPDLGGGAIFFVSNDRTGTLSIRGSDVTHNVNAGLHTEGLSGIYFLGARRPTIVDSKLH